MSEQFQNPKEEKVEDETTTNNSERKEIDRVANKAAEKAAETEKKYDGDKPIFSK